MVSFTYYFGYFGSKCVTLAGVLFGFLLGAILTSFLGVFYVQLILNQPETHPNLTADGPEPNCTDFGLLQPPRPQPLPPSTNQSLGFYYLFTQRSLQTACKVFRYIQCARDVPTNLTIAGLWPMQWYAEMINCRTQQEPFQLAQLGSDRFRRRLTLRWPSPFAYSAANEDFWSRVWRERGSCSKFFLQSYFRSTMELDRRYPVGDWLARAGIVPENSREFSILALEKALDGHAQFQYILNCISITDPIGTKELWLESIQLCISEPERGFHLTACPFAGTSCPRNGTVRFVADYQQIY